MVLRGGFWRDAAFASLLVCFGVDVRSQERDESATVLAQARLLINQGKPQAAIEAIEKLAALGEPGRPAVSHLLGVAYYHADDHAHAVEHLAPVVDRLPAGDLASRLAGRAAGVAC